MEAMANTILRPRGQLTIPAEIRKAVNLEEGDPVEIEIVPDGILLKPRKVIDATQAWFWTPAWQAGEREASQELERAEGKTFDSAEAFLASLD
jgi:AbrB family looped-hinge helix DNA binding protein